MNVGLKDRDNTEQILLFELLKQIDRLKEGGLPCRCVDRDNSAVNTGSIGGNRNENILEYSDMRVTFNLCKIKIDEYMGVLSEISEKIERILYEIDDIKTKLNMIEYIFRKTIMS